MSLFDDRSLNESKSATSDCAGREEPRNSGQKRES